MARPEQRTALAVEIVDLVRRYLEGGLSYNELRTWLGRNWWRPYPTSDRSAADLIQAVELRLDEYAAGYWTEDGLKDSLRALIS
ncbi:MAG TPA: hypothetical protein VGK54_15820 [Chloroflexota bacterium]|jgi:hypothetical protein